MGVCLYMYMYICFVLAYTPVCVYSCEFLCFHCVCAYLCVVCFQIFLLCAFRVCTHFFFFISNGRWDSCGGGGRVSCMFPSTLQNKNKILEKQILRYLDNLCSSNHLPAPFAFLSYGKSGRPQRGVCVCGWPLSISDESLSARGVGAGMEGTY